MLAAIGDILRVDEMVVEIGNWLMVIIPLIGGAMMAYHFAMKSAAQDEAAAAQHAKSIRTIGISTALGMAAMALVTWVVGFVTQTQFTTTP